MIFSLESDEMTTLGQNDSITFTFYLTFSNGIPQWTTFVKDFFDLMFSSESDEMTDQLAAKLSLFMPHSQITYHIEQLL